MNFKMIKDSPTVFTSRELSILVEEYITQQRFEFTLKGLYSYIVYWAMEDHRILGDHLRAKEKKMVRDIIDRISRDGRIRVTEDVTKFIIIT